MRREERWICPACGARITFRNAASIRPTCKLGHTEVVMQREEPRPPRESDGSDTARKGEW